MDALGVLDDPAAAVVALDPLRSKLLGLLTEEPASAAQLADKVGLPRQKVRYHLKTLDEHGLVTQVESRRHGGITERFYAATAASYVVSPDALGDAAVDPSDSDEDRMSASYLIAVAARAVREVGRLLAGGRKAGKPVATLTLDTEIRFATPADRAAFAEELTNAVVTLAARYHQDDGRPHRLVAMSHPIPRQEKS